MSMLMPLPLGIRTPPSSEIPRSDFFNTSLSGSLSLAGASSIANHALNIHNIGNTSINNGNVNVTGTNNNNNVARPLTYNTGVPGSGVSTPSNYYHPHSASSSVNNSGRKNLLHSLNPNQLNTLSNSSSSSGGSSGNSSACYDKSSELRAASMENNHGSVFSNSSFNDENFLNFRGPDDTPRH
ncbi:unnamed protein product [Ambrosiozyma monospora]|uniref:Unnamed protein product n=1 Tax=Ambrosiozyma monospora TaxID=43982 RepID=A0ACB5TF89_AMBMO|nr:unnamed protein product [Ambrosiozyma monospora]